MPEYIETTFKLTSLDHDGRVLLGKDEHDSRVLLGDVKETPRRLKLSFELDGKTHETVLNREQGAIKAGATAEFIDEDGKAFRKEVQPTFAYKSEDGGYVMTFLNDGKFSGLIVGKSHKLVHFVGENGSLRVDKDAASMFPNVEFSERNLQEEENEERDVSAIDYWTGCHKNQDNQRTQSRVDVGFAIGKPFYDRHGNNYVREVNSYITLSNVIYQYQMDVTLAVAEFAVSTRGTEYPWSITQCSRQTSIQDQLNDMRSWSGTQNLPLWHLMENCLGFSGGTLGIAYLTAICDSRINVGVSYYSEDQYTQPGTYPTWATVAHEFGHNFAAQHSFEDGQGRTGGIMDYGYLKDKTINGVDQFNTKYRKREVCSEVDRNIRSSCINKDSSISFTPPRSNIQNTVEERVFQERGSNDRKLECAKHVRAMPGNVVTLKTLLDTPKFQCENACEGIQECSGFVVSEQGWCELIGQTDVDSLVYSAAFDTYVCAEGALRESMSKLTLDDMLERISDVKEANEKCCSVEENTIPLGMNNHYLSIVSKERCERECIKNSRCDAAAFDEANNGCMIFGGKAESNEDFVNSFGFAEGVSTIKCSRGCVENLAGVVTRGVEGAEVDKSVNAAGITFSILGAGILAAVGVAYFINRRNATKSEESQGETVIHKATL